jgi:5-methyltetrahydrofolate--homocysteine methyltransferase
MVGGAAINRQYGQRISFVDGDEMYGAGVFYCKDAFEGLETMDTLIDPKLGPNFKAQVQSDAVAAKHDKERGRQTLTTHGRAGTGDANARSAVKSDNPVPTPPFWGAQVLTRIRLDDVVASMDRNALYRLQWGAKNAKGEEWEKLKAEFDVKVRDLMREADRDGWLEPKVVYGYYPCQSEGQEIIVYDPTDRSKVLQRFVFPRQPERERLCLADYYRSVASGEYDVIALQVVTMGTKVDDLTEELQKQGDYSRSYFIHGLAVSLAEGLAEYTNKLVRQSLGLAGEQGRRYSWGYPACPDLDEHTKLFAILPTDKIDVSLTEAFQLIPEQSTAAMVVHHPEAKYFSIGSAGQRAEEDVAALQS